MVLLENEHQKILLFEKCCFFKNNFIYLYGHYQGLDIKEAICFKTDSETIQSELIVCSRNSEFCLRISNINIVEIISINFNNSLKSPNFKMEFPFKDKLNYLTKEKSNIISTMTRNYNNRLDEWINYNLKLGFDAIVIFDNSNEQEKKDANIKEVTDKYQDKVLVIDFPYRPFSYSKLFPKIQSHWNNIQRLSLHIGVNSFRDKCRYIALIDADEFIVIPEKSNIRNFLSKYNQTIQIQGHLLTNKGDKNIINNNILSICTYEGNNKFYKVILNTDTIDNSYNGTRDVTFIMTPHSFPGHQRFPKNLIIYYHCWVNKKKGRYTPDMKYLNLSNLLK